MIAMKVLHDERLGPVIWLVSASVLSICSFWWPLTLLVSYSEVEDTRIEMLMTGALPFTFLAGAMAGGALFRLFKRIRPGSSCSSQWMMVISILLFAVAAYPTFHILMLLDR